MRFLLLAAALAGTLGVASGCGGDDKAPPIEPGSGGSGLGKGGKSGVNKPDPVGGAGADGGGGGEGPVSDPLAPSVTITSPTDLDDPNAEGVLLGADVDVTCVVKQSELTGSTAVDGKSIKLARLDADGAVAEEKAVTPGEGEDEYTANFSLTEASAGRIRFRCIASDISRRAAIDTVTTFFDKGPVITFIAPEPDSFHPLTSVLEVEFTVEAAPLSDEDEGAAVEGVTLNAAGIDIDLSEAESEPGHYRLEIELTDATLFNPAPNGPFPLTVAAQNQRTEAEATRTTSIDGAGPVLKITSPADKQVVGGRVAITFSAQDSVSGVDPSTVVVAINMVEHQYDVDDDAWTYLNGVYTFAFDSRQVQNSTVQITVNVGASDKVGNVAAAASELLFLDNHPPIVDLDPGNIRTFDEDKCSRSFDPVGSNAVNDLGSAAQFGMFRALVLEQTNTDPEATILRFAGNNQASGRLYVRHESEAPLLIDRDGIDGICDEVSQVDSTASLALPPITATGSPWYGQGEETVPPAMGGFCTSAAGSEPTHLCSDESDMFFALKQFTDKTEPAVYASGVGPTLACAGEAWEFSTKLEQDGWVCFVARVVDNVGNVGVSAPLRMCVDDPAVAGTPACATASTPPPSCTDGCTAPSHFAGGFFELK